MKGLQIGNWELTSRVGHGGMGEVYLARHVVLGTPAAVKMLAAGLTSDPGFRDRFFREAKTMAELRHPHVAQVIDYTESDDCFYLIIEYLDGGSLADLLHETGGPVAAGYALGLAKQVLSALAYAHDHGIVHRDVKPSNIMLDRHGQVKVLDFGIAVEPKVRKITGGALALGTPEYMSPEQITHPTAVDHRTDIYSFGVVLHELLSGRHPFEAESQLEMLQAHVGKSPPPLGVQNPSAFGLELLVQKAMAKNPGARFADCGSFLAAIEALEASGGLSIPNSLPPRTGFHGRAEGSAKSSKKCRECGATISLSSRFCTACGAPDRFTMPGTPPPSKRETQRSCPSCGKETPARAAFCNRCGSKLNPV